MIAEAGDGSQAVELAAQLQPDLVLMDIRMPKMDGLEATRRISSDEQQGRTRVLILTTFDIDQYVFEALRAGASGFLLKEAPPEQILAAVRLVTSGDALLTPPSTRRLIERFSIHSPTISASGLEELTEREGEVLARIARGRSNSELSATLHLSAGTVKSHVAHIPMKLGARDRVQAVIAAYESGLIKPASADHAGPHVTRHLPHLRVPASQSSPNDCSARRAAYADKRLPLLLSAGCDTHHETESSGLTPRPSSHSPDLLDAPSGYAPGDPR